jgi:hypothetical protein
MDGEAEHFCGLQAIATRDIACPATAASAQATSDHYQATAKDFVAHAGEEPGVEQYRLRSELGSNHRNASWPH